jgi:hypothetical protein
MHLVSEPSAPLPRSGRSLGTRRERVAAAFPGIEFRPRTLNLLAWLVRALPECRHLETDHSWAAIIHPDLLYLRGQPVCVREMPRPEVSLCRLCARRFLEQELAQYGGRAVAFEPDAQVVTQYFFVAREDFQAAGLLPELSDALERRLARLNGECELCSRPARWLWFSRHEVQSLDDAGSVSAARGQQFCAEHGAETLCAALQKIEQVNLLYVNIPYREAGAYVWI